MFKKACNQYIKLPEAPFTIPFIAFMILLSLEGIHSHAIYILYPIKTLVVGLLILILWKRLPKLNPKNWILSCLVGLVAWFLWVGLDPLLAKSQSSTEGFNPSSVIEGPLVIWLLIFRVIGAALVVPIMEELFWRGFLMRFLISSNFKCISLGRYTFSSFWLTTLAFTSVHGSQWPLALIVGTLYGAWFVYSKSLGNIILAHGITNLLLAAYVVFTKQWYFW